MFYNDHDSIGGTILGTLVCAGLNMFFYKKGRDSVLNQIQEHAKSEEIEELRRQINELKGKRV